MPTVKIVYVQDDYSDDEMVRILKDMTAWETVTDEELALLTSHSHLLRPLYHYPNWVFHPRLIVQDDRPIAHHLMSVRAEIVALEQHQQAANAKAAAAIAKREEQKLKNKQKLLAQLKRELGEEA